MKESKLSRLDKIKLTALMISLGAHGVFLATSNNLLMSRVVVPPSGPEHLFHVKIAREERIATQPPTPKEPVTMPQETFRFESPTAVKNIESFLQKEQDNSKDKQQMVLHEKMNKPAEVKEELQVIAADNPRNFDSMRSKVDRKTVSLANAIPLDPDDIMDQADEVVNAEPIYKDFVDKMPGFTPSLVKNTFDVAKRAESNQFSQKQMPVISRIKEMDNLERALVWTLGMYEDPRDHQKYFKITIRVGEDNNILKTNKKEVLFLVDFSQSVQEERVAEFKEGITQALNKLNEGDLYNVIVFKEIIFEFNKESVPPTSENIVQTSRFMDKLQTAEKTDAFEVLSKAIDKKTQGLPTYVVLLSDGRPTKGVTNSREVINKISAINKGKKAIFTLSGGLRVNRYLLDFIAYKNRGWSEFSGRTHQISDQVVQLYQKIDDPIIMNLRYNLSGLDEKETFPTILPDFFRNAEFTLYGKYNNEKEFAMQLLGDVETKTREYILRSDFTEAYTGDSDIARNWAFNKLFHLISQLRYDQDNKALIAQIEELSKKFDLQNPYLEDMIR